ncbi:MAG: hypothetical protein KDB79_02975 [Acidobacteria bacterium]|nr:hypothetical protein [Acidobacteriota bacterium]
MGDNFSYATFKHWVKIEFNFQVEEFTRACSRGCDAAMTWIESRNKARWSFYQTCESAQSEIKGINDQLAAAYQFSARAAATVQFAAESFLIWAPFAAAAPVSLLAVGGRLLLYVGSGLSINIAESIGEASSSDLIVMPDATVVVPTVGIGLAGGTAEGQALVEANEKLLRSSTAHIDYLNKTLARLEGDLKTVAGASTPKLNVKVGNASVAYRSTLNAEMTQQLEKSLRDQISKVSEELAEQKNVQSVAKNALRNTSPKFSNYFGKGLTTVCIVLAVSSQKQTTQKFMKHWNGQL